MTNFCKEIGVYVFAHALALAVCFAISVWHADCEEKRIQLLKVEAYSNSTVQRCQAQENLMWIMAHHKKYQNDSGVLHYMEFVKQLHTHHCSDSNKEWLWINFIKNELGDDQPDQPKLLWAGDTSSFNIWLETRFYRDVKDYDCGWTRQLFYHMADGPYRNQDGVRLFMDLHVRLYRQHCNSASDYWPYTGATDPCKSPGRMPCTYKSAIPP